MNIPVAIYDLATIEGRHELLSVNFLIKGEKLLTFDHLNSEQRNNRIEYMRDYGVSDESISIFDEMFDKMEVFSYFVGDIDYVPANYGFILNSNGQIDRVAPLFDKIDAMSKQTITLSQSLLSKIGLEKIKIYLGELATKLNIEEVYIKLKSRGIVIPDDLMIEQINVFNYNFEMLENQLNISENLDCVKEINEVKII